MFFCYDFELKKGFGMKRLLSTLLLSTSLISSLGAVTADTLLRFFPDIICPPQVELGLPTDTQVKMMESGDIFWGHPEALASLQFTRTLESLTLDTQQPLFWVRISMNEAQTGPKSFSSPDWSGEQAMKQMGLSSTQVKWYQWGPYPVRALTAESNEVFFAMAHVGLNYCSNTLVISMACPKPMSATAIKQAKQQWHTLMTNTRFSPWPNEEERERFLDQVL